MYRIVKNSSRTKNRENMSGSYRFLISQQLRALLLILFIGGASLAMAQADFRSDSSSVVDKLFVQQACWNNGDIDCFMETYWKSDSLKFIGKDGITYGWQATIDRYKSKYPDQSYMGTLSFNVLALEYLGSNTLMLVGKWDLKRTMGDVGGHFTLIWKRISGEWVIIADHTS